MPFNKETASIAGKKKQERKSKKAGSNHKGQDGNLV